jgi:hypothetical protein
MNKIFRKLNLLFKFFKKELVDWSGIITAIAAIMALYFSWQSTEVSQKALKLSQDTFLEQQKKDSLQSIEDDIRFIANNKIIEKQSNIADRQLFLYSQEIRLQQSKLKIDTDKSKTEEQISFDHLSKTLYTLLDDLPKYGFDSVKLSVHFQDSQERINFINHQIDIFSTEKDNTLLTKDDNIRKKWLKIESLLTFLLEYEKNCMLGKVTIVFGGKGRDSTPADCFSIFYTYTYEIFEIKWEIYFLLQEYRTTNELKLK